MTHSQFIEKWYDRVPEEMRSEFFHDWVQHSKDVDFERVVLEIAPEINKLEIGPYPGHENHSGMIVWGGLDRGLIQTYAKAIGLTQTDWRWFLTNIFEMANKHMNP